MAPKPRQSSLDDILGGGSEPRSAEDSVDRVFLPWRKDAPLAARMRPRTLDEFVGQEQILGPGKLLRRAIEADRVGSIILWGPPGSGKTTLARVIAGVTRSHFEVLNAVLAGVKEIREVVAAARERLEGRSAGSASGPSPPRRTTLFVDEVHRFNKAQQDALLPHVENGTITFIGATTENPYFEVIKALVSRSRIFQLEPLTNEHLREVARRALADPERGYGGRKVRIEPSALDHLCDVAQGDARNVLNALELAVETTAAGLDGTIAVDERVAEESIQRRALLYDKDGDAHYDTISAFIKSLRGSDPDAALYWLARMVRAGEDARFIARRLVIFASEDVGMADPQALSVAAAAAQAVEFVGLPECQWNLAHAAIYLATAPKSNSAIGYFEALQSLEKSGATEVPDPLKDPSRDREGLGHGEGYKYPHAFREHWVAQQYLPGALQGAVFYHPGDLGFESAVKDRVDKLRGLQTSGIEREARLEEVAGGKARRRRAQIEEFGEARVRRRDRLIEKAGLPVDAAVLDLGESPGLIAWGALDRSPLGKISALVGDAAAARKLRERSAAERVDRILEAIEGFPERISASDGAFDFVLGLGALHGREVRKTALGEIHRVLRPGGTMILHEPLLAEGRRLCDETDLRPLGEDLARRIREVEEEIFRDAGDPRMTLTPEELTLHLTRAGFHELKVERTIEPTKRAATAETLARWFSQRREGGRASYEERLLERISPDELAAYRKHLETELRGRTLARPTVWVVCSALR